MSQDHEALDLAMETYHLIEKHFRDPKYGGYTEALSADWKPMDDVRLSEKDENTPKSMNSHLHIIEPYANLYRAKADNELRVRPTMSCVRVSSTASTYSPTRLSTRRPDTSTSSSTWTGPS